jgi:hypothetical protein
MLRADPITLTLDAARLDLSRVAGEVYCHSSKIASGSSADTT